MEENKYVAEILSVGTELLLGNITDTNAAFIARGLAQVGIPVYHKTTVGDNHQRLLDAVTESFTRANMIIITGGLGPTLDDITKPVVAQYFGLELTLHQPSLQRIQERFKSLGRDFTKLENVDRNAMVPQGATVLPNDFGSAPGVVISAGGKTAILLPGPPSEMEPMFTHHALPYLQDKSGQVFVSKTLKLVGIGESQAETTLLDLIKSQTNPTIAPYAKIGELEIRVTAAAPSAPQAQQLMAPTLAQIKERLGQYIYNADGKSLPQVAIDALRASGHTIAVAESCTGGLLMDKLVSVPGCSDIVLEGATTYANPAKIARLGVLEDTLATHGAVSAAVAAQMAQGIVKTSNATVGLATTGIAGPGGGTPEKPVGLVYIGLATPGEVLTKQINLIGTRNEIRERAALAALDFLRQFLCAAAIKEDMKS